MRWVLLFVVSCKTVVVCRLPIVGVLFVKVRWCWLLIAACCGLCRCSSLVVVVGVASVLLVGVCCWRLLFVAACRCSLLFAVSYCLWLAGAARGCESLCVVVCCCCCMS